MGCLSQVSTKGKVDCGNDILMSSSVIGNKDVTVYGTSGEDSLQTVLLQMPQS